MTLSIGQVAEEVGCKIQTIRYYEEIGVLNPPLRSNGNHRIYDLTAVARLKFIRHARELGFSLDAIRDLLSLAEEPGRSCNTVDKIARKQLSEIKRKVHHLLGLEKELRRMVRQCSGGTIEDCQIIDAMK
jgi:Cu(I)-responsive transcriptional regulator